MPGCQDNTTVRDTILDAAGRLFEHFGYKKTTMDDIAHEAGVGKATIYVYFPSKAETALTWIDRSNCIMLDDLRAIAQKPTSVPERLEELLHHRVMVRYDRAQHFVQSFDELFAPVHSALLVKRDQINYQEASVLGGVIAEGAASGLFECEDAEAAGYHFVLATNSFMPYSLSADRLGDRARVEENVSQIAHLLLYGLARREDQCSRGEKK
jgi:AcrR family transcriptional regulator